MILSKTAIIVLALGAAAAVRSPSARHEPETFVVRMVDKTATEYVFEPASITAHRGDVIQFVQTNITPHNVEFKNLPDGANLGAMMMGPFLTAPEQTYEVTITEGFKVGTYDFVCTPHEFLGMRGSLTVAPAP